MTTSRTILSGDLCFRYGSAGEASRARRVIEAGKIIAYNKKAGPCDRNTLIIIARVRKPDPNAKCRTGQPGNSKEKNG